MQWVPQIKGLKGWHPTAGQAEFFVLHKYLEISFWFFPKWREHVPSLSIKLAKKSKGCPSSLYMCAQTQGMILACLPRYPHQISLEWYYIPLSFTSMHGILEKTSSLDICISIGVTEDEASGPRIGMNLLYAQKKPACLTLRIDANC